MMATRHRKEAGAVGLPFFLSIWLSLCVAILSALAPLGPPSSTLTGSAFNPATMSVALKGRAEGRPVAVRATEPDGGGLAPPGPETARAVAVAAPKIANLPLWAWLAPVVLVAPARIGSLLDLLTSARPRAPPLFS